MARHDSIIPGAKTAAHTVGEYINRTGPVDISDIRLLLKTTRDESIFAMLETWISRGWFCSEGNNKIVLTRRARQYFDAATPAAPDPGTIATGPQFNMLTRPPYKPKKTVRRQDIPEWSLRPEGFGFIGFRGVQP